MTPAPERPDERLLRMFDEAAAWPSIRQAIRDVLLPEQAAVPVTDAGLREAALDVVDAETSDEQFGAIIRLRAALARREKEAA